MAPKAMQNVVKPTNGLRYGSQTSGTRRTPLTSTDEFSRFEQRKAEHRSRLHVGEKAS